MLAFLRALTFAAQNFWRNLWLSVVTVVILALSMFFMNALNGLKMSADQALTQVRNRVEITVFFRSTAPDEEMQNLQSRLEKLPEVASVDFVSKEEALENFRASIKGDQTLEDALTAIGTNPLQASLIIRARNLDQYPQILSVVNESTYESLIEQDHVADAKLTFIQRFSDLTRNLSRIGFGVSVLFALIAVLVVFNTIRITIYAYREEIGIMKLVGASNAFVRAPFILESIMYALIAAIVAMAALWFLLLTLTPFLNGLLDAYNVSLGNYLQGQFFPLVLPALLIGIVLSMVSSAVAVGRYLKI